MKKVEISINGKKIEVPSNYTILEAAKANGFKIPTLCYLKDINEIGACRMCVVEIEGARSLQASCVLPVRDGMKIKTNSKRVRESRKTTMELLLANHNRECLMCNKNGYCELQKISEELGIQEVRFEGAKREGVYDDISPSIVRDSSKCILCGRCVNVCKNVQGIGILDFVNRGFETVVAPAFEFSLTDVPCISCGQCIIACPTGALTEKDNTDLVFEAIEDDDIHVVVQTAPAVRAALGELFGYEIGTGVTGKMVASLRALGFDKVFDTNFGADLTIMEEGTELIGRIKNGGKLPLITSCSPGWVNYCERFYPEFLENTSSCKSPHQMFGAIVKSYYAEKTNIDPRKIVVVSVMPCVAKKGESLREEMQNNGLRDVDIVITTRELGKMIKSSGIDFNSLQDEEADKILGDYTGASVIFGATGGVMEAALRTVAEVLTGQDLPEVEYNSVRGMKGIKEADIQIGDLTVRAAIAHGTENASILLERIKSGEKNYDFIEIMGCPGGCVNGGGQPFVTAEIRNSIDIAVERAKVLYSEDKGLPLRKSHKNPEIVELYKDFLGEPNSHLAHELLHTHYSKKEKYSK
ncbi:NADH-dependent [FeFe] hydrogenase, group A6 [Clostridiaceae bacterium HSG29]|nr:NADH-dependent [FeFe] hydrogenase, group A6 [Clostridiaceae bacterium HSG29]